MFSTKRYVGRDKFIYGYNDCSMNYSYETSLKAAFYVQGQFFG